MPSRLLAGALALLWCSNVESFTVEGGVSKKTPGFVNSAIPMSRKRPRGTCTARLAPAAAAGVPSTALTGSFTAAKIPGIESAWFGRVGNRSRVVTHGRTSGGGSDGLRMIFGLGFHPPEFGVFVHGTVQAIMLGAFAALIPKVTAERIREKEEGLAKDEAYEAGLLDDYDDDEFGYAGGNVCPACDNTNEIECPKCGGKGFFVTASAMPRKCDYCSGLGTVPCELCEERRERLERERRGMASPGQLPPGRGEDFPVPW